MRDIKFRAWDIEKDQWIDSAGTTFTGKEPTEGVVALTLDGHLRVFSTHCFDATDDDEAMHVVSHSEYESTHPVDTNPRYKKQYALMQYTGLKDKNGVEIYEGDICRQYDKDFFSSKRRHPIKTLKVIKWDDTRPQFNFYNAKRLEVIGNIYENPSLLGDQDEATR